MYKTSKKRQRWSNTVIRKTLMQWKTYQMPEEMAKEGDTKRSQNTAKKGAKKGQKKGKKAKLYNQAKGMAKMANELWE